jgi:hypothetical protein
MSAYSQKQAHFPNTKGVQQNSAEIDASHSVSRSASQSASQNASQSASSEKKRITPCITECINEGCKNPVTRIPIIGIGCPGWEYRRKDCQQCMIKSFK